jgi:hypothetical protein
MSKPATGTVSSVAEGASKKVATKAAARRVASKVATS